MADAKEPDEPGPEDGYQWEMVSNEGKQHSTWTDRLPVPGGWLYRTMSASPGDGEEAGERFAVALAFVPDRESPYVG